MYNNNNNNNTVNNMNNNTQIDNNMNNIPQPVTKQELINSKSENLSNINNTNK